MIKVENKTHFTHDGKNYFVNDSGQLFQSDILGHTFIPATSDGDLRIIATSFGWNPEPVYIDWFHSYARKQRRKVS